MSFTGNLAHLPIVDVIQLLDATKKSGTLNVKQDGIEYNFTFLNGIIVSVEHPDTAASLAQVLSRKKLMSEDNLNDALTLARQQNKSLLSLLFEQQKLNVQSAVKALQHLAELTIVDILTWEDGIFELSVDASSISEEFKSVKDITNQDVCISTQNTLMEALRLFDEWRRDNVLQENIFKHHKQNKQKEAQKESEFIISEDILGLDNIDKLERKIPGVFTGIKIKDNTELHKKKILASFPGLAQPAQQQLINFLIKYETSKSEIAESRSTAVVLFSKDEFTIHTLTVLCGSLGMFVFSTDDEENLNIIIKQSLHKSLMPVLIIDVPKGETNFTVVALKILKTTIMQNYPAVRIVQFIDQKNPNNILSEIREGVVAVLKPENGDSLAEDTIIFYESILGFLKKINTGIVTEVVNLNEFFNKICSNQRITDVVLTCSDFFAQFYKRIAVFVLQQNDLVAENVTGISDVKLPVRLPILPSSNIYKTLQSGEIFLGKLDEQTNALIFNVIAKPEEENVCLMPLKGANKVAALIYADSKKASVPFFLFELLQKYANARIESFLYRKMFEKTKKSE